MRPNVLLDLVRMSLALILSGDLDIAGARDLIDQFALYESYRPVLEPLFPGATVVVMGGRFYVGDTLDEVGNRAAARNPGRFYYAAEQP